MSNRVKADHTVLKGLICLNGLVDVSCVETCVETGLIVTGGLTRRIDIVEVSYVEKLWKV
jgi:hypothetical protein